MAAIPEMELESVPSELAQKMNKISKAQQEKAMRVAQGLEMDAFDILEISKIEKTIKGYPGAEALNIRDYNLAAKKAFNVISYLKNCTMCFDNDGKHISEEQMFKNMQEPEFRKKFVEQMGKYTGFPKELNEQIFKTHLKHEFIMQEDVNLSFAFKLAPNSEKQIAYIKQNIDVHIDLETRFKTVLSVFKTLFHEKKYEEIPERLKQSAAYMVGGHSGTIKAQNIEQSFSKTVGNVMNAIENMRASVQSKLGLDDKKNTI